MWVIVLQRKDACAFAHDSASEEHKSCFVLYWTQRTGKATMLLPVLHGMTTSMTTCREAVKPDVHTEYRPVYHVPS